MEWVETMPDGEATWLTVGQEQTTRYLEKNGCSFFKAELDTLQASLVALSVTVVSSLLTAHVIWLLWVSQHDAAASAPRTTAWTQRPFTGATGTGSMGFTPRPRKRQGLYWCLPCAEQGHRCPSMHVPRQLKKGWFGMKPCDYKYVLDAYVFRGALVRKQSDVHQFLAVVMSGP